MMDPQCYNNNMFGVNLIIVDIIHSESNKVFEGM